MDPRNKETTEQFDYAVYIADHRRAAAKFGQKYADEQWGLVGMENYNKEKGWSWKYDIGKFALLLETLQIDFPLGIITLGSTGRGWAFTLEIEGMDSITASAPSIREAVCLGYREVYESSEATDRIVMLDLDPKGASMTADEWASIGKGDKEAVEIKTPLT